MKKKIDYKMLSDLLMIPVYEGETPEQALEKWEQKTRIFTNRQMDLSVDRAVESGLINEGDDILDLWFAKQEKEVII